MELKFEIRPTDRFFLDSPYPGDPECLCSRCLKLIGEDEVPIMFWTQNGKKKWRYHAVCLGFKPDNSLVTELTYKKELN